MLTRNGEFWGGFGAACGGLSGANVMGPTQGTCDSQTLPLVSPSPAPQLWGGVQTPNEEFWGGFGAASGVSPVPMPPTQGTCDDLAATLPVPCTPAMGKVQTPNEEFWGGFGAAGGVSPVPMPPTQGTCDGLTLPPSPSSPPSPGGALGVVAAGVGVQGCPAAPTEGGRASPFPVPNSRAHPMPPRWHLPPGERRINQLLFILVPGLGV